MRNYNLALAQVIPSSSTSIIIYVISTVFRVFVEGLRLL